MTFSSSFGWYARPLASMLHRPSETRQSEELSEGVSETQKSDKKTGESAVDAERAASQLASLIYAGEE